MTLTMQNVIFFLVSTAVYFWIVSLDFVDLQTNNIMLGRTQVEKRLCNKDYMKLIFTFKTKHERKQYENLVFSYSFTFSLWENIFSILLPYFVV